MAKDGTMRGGLRTGSGQKKKALREKLLAGDTVDTIAIAELPTPEELAGEDTPEVADWLKEDQKDGDEWQAEELAKRVFVWLRRMGCEHIITDQQVYSYAVAQARWIQCQRALSKYGFLAKHPKTNQPVESPFVDMADKFSKQAAATWWSIYQIVKANGDANATGDPKEKTMAGLLS